MRECDTIGGGMGFTHRLALLCLLVVGAGAGGGCDAVLEAIRPAPTSVRVAQPKVGVPTDAQVREVGEAFVAAVYRGDEDGWLALLDRERMVRIALAGRELPVGFLKDFIQGFSAVKGQWFPVYQAIVDEGGQLRLLRTARDDAGHWAVIGAIHPEGEFNQLYLRVVLVEGAPRWVDLWTLADASYFSATVVGSVDQVLLASGALDPEGTRRVSEVAKLNKLLLARDYVGALDAYDAAAPDVKALRMSHASRVGAAVMADIPDERYRAILEDFVRAFPDDPAARVHAIDLHVLKGEHVEAARVVEALHVEHPDAYLLAFASSLYKLGGDLVRARVAADGAVALEPTLSSGWLQQLQIAADTGDAEAVTRGLEVLGREHGATAAWFEAADWASLRTMPAYVRWVVASDG